MPKSFAEIASFYTQKYAFQPPKITEEIRPDCGLIVVIPCFNEPDLIGIFRSLLACSLPENKTVEIITVLNASENAPESVLKRNQETYQNTKQFLDKNLSKKLHFYFIFAEKLPRKQAGVGLARKIGMDEALFRFSQIQTNEGIVCLDADCEVAPNYLSELLRIFADSKTQSVAIHFEHRTTHFAEEIVIGIQNYELFLRYYVAGLRFAGFPSPFHTVGSSMAIRASAYALSGGMNRRKAGEDFYFLHKVALLGGFRELNSTAVFPSPRTSDRVPFGTGKAQKSWLDNSEKILFSYNFQVFEDLKIFCQNVPQFFQADGTQIKEIISQFPPSIQAYLTQIPFEKSLIETNRQSTKLATFEKRFWQNFDGLKVLKFVHFARDNFYESVPITEACQELLRKTYQHEKPETLNLAELLELFRELDKNTNLAN